MYNFPEQYSDGLRLLCEGKKSAVIAYVRVQELDNMTTFKFY